MAWWRSGYSVGLATNRPQVRVPVAPLHVTSLGKLFTHICLCLPNSINWYRPKGGDDPMLGSGKVTVGLASHWPCVTDPPTGSTVLAREMSTPPTLQIRLPLTTAAAAFLVRELDPQDDILGFYGMFSG